MHVRPTRISLSERIEEVASVIPKSSHPRLSKKGASIPCTRHSPPPPPPRWHFVKWSDSFAAGRASIVSQRRSTHPIIHLPQQLPTTVLLEEYVGWQQTHVPSVVGAPHMDGGEEPFLKMKKCCCCPLPLLLSRSLFCPCSDAFSQEGTFVSCHPTSSSPVEEAPLTIL